MASKFICLLLLFASQSVQSSSVDVEERTKADKWIEETLLPGNDKKIKECASIPEYPKKPANFKPNPYPSWTVVILQEEFEGNYKINLRFCIGSLIDMGVVLTTAGCMSGLPLANLKVRANDGIFREPNSSNDFQERRIKSVIIHEKYNEITLVNDIAFVFLREPFKKTPQVAPICPARYWTKEHVRCSIYGWRSLRNESKRSQKSYFSIFSTVVPKVPCEKVLQTTALGESFRLLHDSMCAKTTFEPVELKDNAGAAIVCSVCSPRQRVIQAGILRSAFNTSALPLMMTAVNTHFPWIVSKCNGSCNFRSC